MVTRGYPRGGKKDIERHVEESDAGRLFMGEESTWLCNGGTTLVDADELWDLVTADAGTRVTKGTAPEFYMNLVRKVGAFKSKATLRMFMIGGRGWSPDGKRTEGRLIEHRGVP